jgi:hypothetical protein
MSAKYPARAAAALLAAAGLAGCSLALPYSPQPTQPRATSAPDAPDPAPERGGTIPAADQAAQLALAAAAAQPTPQAAVARYAQLAVNWTWRDLAAVERHLAALSLGPARAQALQAAAHAAADTTLRQQRVRNSGRAVAIAPGQAQAAGRWVIVTRERTTGQGAYAGLPPTLHVSYAQLTHTRRGFVVSQWQAQT